MNEHPDLDARVPDFKGIGKKFIAKLYWRDFSNEKFPYGTCLMPVAIAFIIIYNINKYPDISFVTYAVIAAIALAVSAFLFYCTLSIQNRYCLIFAENNELILWLSYKKSLYTAVTNLDDFVIHQVRQRTTRGIKLEYYLKYGNLYIFSSSNENQADKFRQNLIGSIKASRLI